MLVKSNAFNLIVLGVSSIKIPNNIEAKCADYRTEAQRAALALLDGKEFSGAQFSVSNPAEIAYTSGVVIGSLVDVTYGNSQLNVTNKKGAKSTRTIDTIESGVVACNMVSSMIKLYCEYFLIERTADSKGTGLTSVMRAQMSVINQRIDDICDRSIILALSCEQVFVVDSNAVYVTGHAPVVYGLDGYSLVKASNSTVIEHITDLSVDIKISTVSAITQLTQSVYDDQIGALGVADWLSPDSWIVKFSRTSGFAWTPDKYTVRMTNTAGSAFYHCNRFVKRFYSGDAAAATKIGSGAFANLYHLVNRKESGVSDIPESLANYLLSLDILETSISDIASAFAVIDIMQSGTIDIDVETLTERGEYLSSLAGVHPALWPDHEDFAFIAPNTIRSPNIAITYSSDIDEAHLGIAKSIADLEVEDMQEVRELLTHMTFVLSLFHHASHVGEVKNILGSPIRLKDSVGSLRSLGLEYLMYPGGDYVIRI